VAADLISRRSAHAVRSQDSLDLLLGFSYTINKRLALHVNYNYTLQSSLGLTPGARRSVCNA
jgi:hypothetical protein